jgi:hydrogenase maturation protease
MLAEARPSQPARTDRCPVLVLGVGNILLRDEGVGVRVVEAMQQMDLPPGVELVDGATAGFDLLDVLADRQKVIVIDAIDGDFKPGTVLRFSAEEATPQAHAGVSLHEVGILEALAATRLLGIAPAEVTVLGVKPKDDGYGLELSAQVGALVPRIIDLVRAEL